MPKIIPTTWQHWQHINGQYGYLVLSGIGNLVNSSNSTRWLSFYSSLHVTLPNQVSHFISSTVMYMSLHHSNWITWVVALWLFNVTCFHIQIEAKDLFYMFYKLQDASCTQSGIGVGSLNRVPFWVAGMSHCTTWQERAELSKSLPCSMIGTVIVQKVKIR